ncbi:hypothetical protein [Streptomyces sp. SPB4]|uniref:hypothetical protein n=1 Tax=Streptomyces sp. SPB4 TaxID=2940553 RepID=UPI0024771579|nr:hypothetical protein [Streptomyces sp. SPB4]
MTAVFEPTEQARAAAVRAAALADIARRRTLVASAWTGRALIEVAELLDIVTLSLYEEAPTSSNGICDSARLALTDAGGVVAETPGTGFPSGFGQYVTHVLDRRPLTTPPSHEPTGWSLADEDAQLVAALEALHGYLAAAATETVALALLEAVFALHEKRAELVQFTRG